MLHFVDESASDAGLGSVVALSGPEAHHAARVRRVRPGERVSVTDGRGIWLGGTVEAAEATRVDIRIDSREEIAVPARRIVLAQALAKGDRDELAVQAATELGVDGILPWQAARSVSRWQGPKAAKGRARWSAVAREAAKQAHRAWIPSVEDVCSTRELAARAKNGSVVVLDPRADRALTSFEPPASGDVIVVVGPEGGVAPEELETLTAAGAVPVRLGDLVLRTSTAGPAAIALLSARLGRW